MRRHTAVLSVGLCSVLVVTGCKSTKHAAIPTTAPKVVPNSASASSSAAVSATPSTPPSAPPPSSIAPPAAPVSSAAATPSGSATPPPLDPCQLVTASEASALAGTTFGAGVESTTDGGGRICVYGGKTTNVFMVLVAQAADSKTANADWAQEEAQAQAAMVKDVPGGVTPPKVGEVTGIGDRAATASASLPIRGQTINISAIYILKGATFLTYSDLVLNKPAPTIDALAVQSTVSLARIP
jgi:hypothetical protein